MGSMMSANTKLRISTGTLDVLYILKTVTDVNVSEITKKVPGITSVDDKINFLLKHNIIVRHNLGYDLTDYGLSIFEKHFPSRGNVVPGRTFKKDGMYHGMTFNHVRPGSLEFLKIPSVVGGKIVEKDPWLKS